MKLSRAANYFDQQVCEDATDSSSTFKAQLDLFDDSKRDGTTVVRRVLSVKPGTVLPASGTLKIAGRYYIVGGSHDDLFNNSAIRTKYIVQQGDPVKLKTLAQLAAGSAGTATYADKIWVKDMKEPDESSRLFPFFNVFVPAPLVISLFQVIVSGADILFVRSVYESAGGFKTLETNILDAASVAAVAYVPYSGAYDPVTDKYTTAATINTSAVVLRYEDFFLRVYASAERMQPGDMCLAVAKSAVATPAAGDLWTANSITYRVLSVLDDASTSWLLHSRRA